MIMQHGALNMLKQHWGWYPAGRKISFVDDSRDYPHLSVTMIKLLAAAEGALQRLRAIDELRSRAGW
jgi:hypothetical protein